MSWGRNTQNQKETIPYSDMLWNTSEKHLSKQRSCSTEHKKCTFVLPVSTFPLGVIALFFFLFTNPDINVTDAKIKGHSGVDVSGINVHSFIVITWQGALVS